MQRDGGDPDFLGRLGLAENGAWALLPKCEAPEKPVEDPIYPGPLLADLAVRHGYSRARSTAAAPVRATRTGRYSASAAPWRARAGGDGGGRAQGREAEPGRRAAPPNWLALIVCASV